MEQLLVHVEGQTEEKFVNNMLRDHLIESFGYINVSAQLLGNPRRRDRRGGIKGWDTVRGEIIKRLKGNRRAISTTMVDYYGLPKSGQGAWPGRSEDALHSSSERKAKVVENKLLTDITSKLDRNERPGRFILFVVMYEYEGLLFSNPKCFAESILRPDLATDFQNIRDSFATPEEINDSPETAPSKRIKQLIPRYQKPLMGVEVATAIGLAAIRKQCPHFDAWVKKLEEAGR